MARRERSKSAEILRMVAIVIGAGAVLGAVIGFALGQVFPRTTPSHRPTVPPQLRPSSQAHHSPAPSHAGSASASASASHSASAAAGPVHPTGVSAFDPSGDGSENDSDLPKLVDGNPATVWTTQHYNSAAFGGLKAGVGVLLDLGKPVRVASVDVTPAWPGASIEVRTSATRGGTASAYTPLSGAATARYVLVWITSLPAHDGAYRAGIAEIKVNAG